MVTASTDKRLTRGRLGPLERTLRVIGGGLLAVVAVKLALASAGFATWAWFGTALFGLDLVVTGIRGYCPLYARLGLGSAVPDRRGEGRP